MVETKYKERAIRVYSDKIRDGEWIAQIFIYELIGSPATMSLVCWEVKESYATKESAEGDALKFAMSWVDNRLRAPGV